MYRVTEAYAGGTGPSYEIQEPELLHAGGMLLLLAGAGTACCCCSHAAPAARNSTLLLLLTSLLSNSEQVSHVLSYLSLLLAMSAVLNPPFRAPASHSCTSVTFVHHSLFVHPHMRLCTPPCCSKCRWIFPQPWRLSMHASTFLASALRPMP